MKKAISLLLALVLCLSLCACGGDNTNETPSETTNAAETSIGKDDMLAVAKAVGSDQIRIDTFENKAKATQLYCNTTLKVTGYVVSIEEDHIKLGDDFYAGVTVIDVYLPIEDLAALERRQLVTVVGETEDIIGSRTENVAGSDWEQQYFTMSQAYLVSDVYETTMTVEVSVNGAKYAILDKNIKDAFVLEDVLRPSFDLSDFNESCVVTVKGKIKHNGDRHLNEMTDITVVE